jgi:hypothetical protein
VTGLVRRGARPGQLAALDAAVQADVAAGVSAARALDGRARELAGGGRLTDGPLVPPLSTAPGAAAEFTNVTPANNGDVRPATPTTVGGGAPTPRPLPPRRP